MGQLNPHEAANRAHWDARPGTDAQGSYRDESDRAWARRWPMEQIWRLRRIG